MSPPIKWNKEKLLSLLIWFLLLGLAVWLRLPHFSWVAIRFDEVEYPYCVETNQFPHSPYILFLWMGYLLKPFIRLDWGYAGLSMVSSILTIFFLGSTARVLTGSRIAGWGTSLVWILAPIALHVSGIQEVYAFQFCLLSCSWYLAVCYKRPSLAGVALGGSFAVHNGTLFALPATLLLYYRVWGSRRSKEHQEGEPGSSSRNALSCWIHFSFGASIPILATLTWLVCMWFTHVGSEELHRLPLYLKGNSPPADFKMIIPQGDVEGTLDWIDQAWENFEDQLERYWDELASEEVIPRGLILFGFLGLLAVPVSKSGVWWILPLPYIVYETAAGWTLDNGIYSVYVLPTLAMSVAFSIERIENNPLFNLRTAVSVISAVGVFATLLFYIPSTQGRAHHQGLQGWRIEEGSPMALSKWVGNNTPEETIVEVPADWYYSGLGIPYYAGRIPLFRDGYVLNPREWHPIYADKSFDYLKKIDDGQIDKWLDSDQPLLSYDHNPFTGFGAHWYDIDTTRLETRPILWLDRNQTGTSRFWKNPELLLEIHPHLIDEDEAPPLFVKRNFQAPEIEAQLFKATLYRIARKSDPPEHPTWVQELQQEVPTEQHGSPPTWKGKGIVFSDEALIDSPAITGEDHALKILVHSRGQDYCVRCDVEFDGDWIKVGEDMEKYVCSPPEVFTELFFRIPAKYVEDESLKLRLSPSINTGFVNLYHIAVARVDSE